MADKKMVYGFHAVESLLQQAPEKLQTIYLQKGRDDHRGQQLINLAEKRGIKCELCDRQQLDALTDMARHQGVVGIYNEKNANVVPDLFDILDQLQQPAFLLILDGVQDPHNLGACLRSANAAGVHAVIAPKDRAVGITPVVQKVASGAAEITPFIQVTNLARTMKELKERGIWLYGAAEEASENIYHTDLTGGVALVLGAEGEGLRRLTRESCDKLIHIPTVGKISSLNVSVATGICLFEALRQRNFKEKNIRR